MTTIERISTLPGPLKITCHQCHHTVIWTKQQAIDWIGGWRQVYDARVALRCTRCGTKGKVSFDTGPHLRKA